MYDFTDFGYMHIVAMHMHMYYEHPASGRVLVLVRVLVLLVGVLLYELIVCRVPCIEQTRKTAELQGKKIISLSNFKTTKNSFVLE